ncbi:hypothetical protein L3Q82_024413 [Scortum barcoo]|uniref:Uncharacterized protein n=1 Tax=Scortum barcoo TaxID=214431 RepID=A0ACB8WQG2_9TELE|nr:hypothetical protein L3Q82_024413 [Scortum barcoo]
MMKCFGWSGPGAAGLNPGLVMRISPVLLCAGLGRLEAADSREGQTGDRNGAEVSDEGGSGAGDVTERRGGGAEAGEGSEVTGGREETGAESTEQVSETGEVSVNSEDCERQESGEQGDNTESRWIVPLVAAVLGALFVVVVCVVPLVIKLKKEPTVVRVKEGSDAVLPCLLRGENIELKLFDWRKKDDQTGVTKEVFMYEGGDHYNNGREGQDQQFRGRVSHFEGEMKNGNASIIIRNPKVIDSGNYTCDFPLLKPQKTFNIQLVVGASPEPQLQWQDSDGNLVSVKELQVSERGGSNDVIVQATMTKTDTYQCVVTQKEIHHQTQAETFVYISEGSCTNVVAGWSLGSFDLGAVALAAVQALIKSPICSTKGRNKGVKPECVSVSQQSLSSDLLSPADCSLKQRAGH